MSFNLIHYFYNCCAVVWLEYLICVLLSQRCACASIFSSHIFFVFYSPNCSNSFLFFLWISRRINPLNAKTFSHVRAWACILRFASLSVVETDKKTGKIRKWVVKWSWRNEGIEGKKRRRRPKVLNKAAKIVLKKARYKIGDSTTHIVSKPSPERVMKAV